MMQEQTDRAGESPGMNDLLRQRIIESADEYHFIAEDQWAQAIDLKDAEEETLFEFRRLIRAALRFYARAYLVLDMIETDDEQQLEDLLELIEEQEPEVGRFLQQNDVIATLDEESNANVARVFSVAEALRLLLLERGTQLAASLGPRFS
jgi:hypothetical protein